MGIHFTKEEFAERKSRVVKELKKQKLDALLMFRLESMYWLTGYDTFGFGFFQCLILTIKGDLVLFTRELLESYSSNSKNIKILLSDYLKRNVNNYRMNAISYLHV